MQFAPNAWRYALPPLVLAPLAFVLSVFAAFSLVLVGLFVLAFFRDPERTPPASGVVAPADGRISVRRREADGRVRVGVFMNVWNVHVVRSPDDGTVEDVEHTPGAHRPAFSKDSDRNERVHLRFAEEFSEVVDRSPEEVTPVDETTPVDEVTLVAGAFARRITPYVDPGARVDRGERVGHIAFGSRVDVVFPESVSLDDVAVERGQRVRAGETPLLTPDTPRS